MSFFIHKLFLHLHTTQTYELDCPVCTNKLYFGLWYYDNEATPDKHYFLCSTCMETVPRQYRLPRQYWTCWRKVKYRNWLEVTWDDAAEQTKNLITTDPPTKKASTKKAPTKKASSKKRKRKPDSSCKPVSRRKTSESDGELVKVLVQLVKDIKTQLGDLHNLVNTLVSAQK